MTGADKTLLARFLETAGDVLETGFYAVREAASFEDDPPAASPAQTDHFQVAERGVEYGAAAVAAATADAVAGAVVDDLEQIAADIAACERCSLCKTRKNTVPGEGVQQPQVLVVGEAPGADEDAAGRPFVGLAGQKLDQMLASIGLSRTENCFIANTLKCRPPGNRDPSPDERSACSGYLQRQILALKPRAILCAGRIAAQTLLKKEAPLAALRGGRKWDFFPTEDADAAIPLFATYHPSALLRDAQWKRPAWEDLKAFRAFLQNLSG